MLIPRILLAGLLLVVAVQPLRAVPPDGAPSAALVAGGTEGPRSPLAPGRSGGGSPRGWLRSFGALLRTGLVAVLCATEAGVLETAAQPALDPLAFGTMPGFNLSGTDPVSGFVSQGVAQALARANGTGILPPLPDLNALLAQASPTGNSVLQTLPSSGVATAQGPASATSRDTRRATVTTEPQLPSFLLNSPPDRPIASPSVDALATARTTLTVAQLTNAFYILEALGNQLIGDAGLVAPVSPQVGEALEFAGFQLASIGFGFAYLASSENTMAAQHALADLEDQAAKAAEAAQAPPAPPAPPPAPSFDLDRVYGTWQRLDNTNSGQIITYKITRNEFVKLNTTTGADGWETTDMELHPGAVTAYASYRRPGPGKASTSWGTKGGRSASTATVQSPLFMAGEGRIDVKLVVAHDSVQPLVFNFTFLLVGNGTVSFEVLVEQGGQRQAFIREDSED